MASNCHVTDKPGQEDETSRLRELGDPEFFAQWAALRNSIARTPRDAEVKRRYDEVKAEFRRRIDGGLAAGAGS
jgi:hypothetical protein